MRFKFLFFILILLLGMEPRLSRAQSNVTTTSSNSRNQFHRDLLGQCSATRIDCGPNTAITPPGTLTTFSPSGQRIGAVTQGEVRCVSGFGTADGKTPGAVPTGASDLCLTTAGPLWAGEARNMHAGDCGNTRFCNQFFPFTGLPRVPTGADTQFGVGAKSSNRLDIGGTANDVTVPIGASAGVLDFTLRHDFKDSFTSGSAGDDCANFDTNCHSGYKINWTAPKPPDCISCPPTLNGNHFRSEPIFDAGGNLIGRRHTMEYGHTQRWVSAITSNEGNTGTDRGVGEEMQQFVISFSVVSTTDLSGNLTADPTGSYFVELRSLGATTNVDTTAAGTVMSSESGTFSTAVTFPGGVPTANVTMTQQPGGQLGCQHDSGGTSCISRSTSFLP